MAEPKEKINQSKNPEGVLVLFFIIIFVGILTWLLPSGQFGTLYEGGPIDPESFVSGDRNPASPLEMILAIPRGFADAANLIAMILTIGGAIWLIDQTGAIKGAIAASARKLGSERKILVIVVMTLFFACLGAFPAMFEAVIPFAPIAIAVALALGYDLIVGVSMPLIGVVIGWTSGITNLWTTGIGQNMSGLPLFSGMGLRFVFWIVMLIFGIAFIVRYAKKVEKNPEKSLVADVPVDESFRSLDINTIPFNGRHKLIMLVFVITIGLVVWFSIAFEWTMIRLSAFYILAAIAAGIIAGFSPNKITQVFMAGATTIFPATFAIGIARGVSLIMSDSGIIHTIVYHLSRPLVNVAPAVSAGLMVVVQTIINFFIPSGSGQAMATLPVMLPLGQIVGLTDQVTILSFQIGDGLSNLIFPSVPILVAYLAYAKIPFGRWFKYILPLWAILFAVGVIFTAIGVVIGWA